MASLRRIEKINELLKREISGIVGREIASETDVLVTITRVETLPNLSEAKIYFTVLPEKKTSSVLKTLRENTYEIQQILNRRLKMRPVPKIIFKWDKVQMVAEEVYRALSESKKKK